jgi:hypothetical protein
MAIFFSFTLAISFCLMCLNDNLFVDSWTEAYRLNLGDFVEEHASTSERILFLIATLAMPLIMLNLVIAIMSDIYD